MVDLSDPIVDTAREVVPKELVTASSRACKTLFFDDTNRGESGSTAACKLSGSSDSSIMDALGPDVLEAGSARATAITGGTQPRTLDGRQAKSLRLKRRKWWRAPSARGLLSCGVSSASSNT